MTNAYYKKVPATHLRLRFATWRNCWEGYRV